ncbi:hypothetical protein [Modestobacter altitudinis]|uniref:hypothetical protein n=1 Tax=Modestobacter altitudinis TaxID=2213158 RepID=UPI0015D12789|nr:hypothetical protein [Modestobacter altitudinis]
MPRSYDEIVRLSEAMADQLEKDTTEPAISAEESALRAAVLRRSIAEGDVGQAVVAARIAGLSWAAVGSAVGTSGEAARQRYGKLTGEPVASGRKESIAVRAHEGGGKSVVENGGRSASTGRSVASAAAKKVVGKKVKGSR